MSGQWEVYSCRIDGRFATVVFLDQIASLLDALPGKRLTTFKLFLKMPLDNGMPSRTEALALNAIEDEISNRVQELGALYVGRLNSAGQREHFVYGGLSPDQSAAMAREIGLQCGYELFASTRDEPDCGTYWNVLYPTPETRQAMGDGSVLEKLQKHGDRLVTARRIDHWCNFSSGTSADTFAAAVRALEFEIERIEYDDERKAYLVQFHHTAVPAYGDITDTTVSLMHLASDHGGEYDGWETKVIRDLQ